MLTHILHLLQTNEAQPSSLAHAHGGVKIDQVRGDVDQDPQLVRLRGGARDSQQRLRGRCGQRRQSASRGACARAGRASRECGVGGAVPHQLEGA